MNHFIIIVPEKRLSLEDILLAFSARTSIWLFEVVTITSSGEKSQTSTVNWYVSPSVLMFPGVPDRPTEAMKCEKVCLILCQVTGILCRIDFPT